MIEKFQSFNALSEAINKNNYQYYLIKFNNDVAGYIGLHEENKKMSHRLTGLNASSTIKSRI